MNHKLSTFAVIFALCSVSIAQDKAPVRVQVGDSMLNGAALHPYKNQWRVSVTTPQGKQNPDAALWTDDLEYVQVDGRKCLQRTQVATFRQDGQTVGNTTTVNVFDPKTMAPVSRSFARHVSKTGADDLTKVQFRDHMALFEHTVDGKTTRQDAKLDPAAFDFYGGLYGLLLSAFPLKPGFSATLPSVDEETPTVSWLTFKVTGEERADAGPMGTMSVYTVETESNLGPMKFWLSKQAPYIIRLEYTAKDNGYTWKYQMV
jgi:hypothetical protein